MRENSHFKQSPALLLKSRYYISFETNKNISVYSKKHGVDIL